MTIAEAEYILDIVEKALLNDGPPHRYYAVSTLKGYDILQIDAAIKLRIAREYLKLLDQPDFEKQFAEGLNLYGGLPWQIINSFVPDYQVGKSNADLAFDVIDHTTNEIKEPYASLETASSFGN